MNDEDRTLLQAVEAMHRELLAELRAMRSSDDDLARLRRSAADRQARRRAKAVTPQSRESRDSHATAAVVVLDQEQRDLKQETTPARAVIVTGPTRAAYAAAYERRYRVPPVWNATVNGQMANFVKRLGSDEAPLVAAFYLTHSAAKYTGNGHSVGMLLRDAESLRMQWKTQRKVTATGAQQQDKTQDNMESWAEHMSEEGRRALVSK